MNFYLAKVKAYSVITEKLEDEYYLTVGNNFQEAAAALSEYVGEKDIEKMSLDYLYDCSCLPLDKNLFTTLKEIDVI